LIVKLIFVKQRSNTIVVEIRVKFLCTIRLIAVSNYSLHIILHTKPDETNEL